MDTDIETNDQGLWVDESLAPSTWDGYIGQRRAKKRLQIAIEAAKREHRRLKHMLITSSAGKGKTTLAEIVATEMGDNFKPLTMTPNFKMPSLYKIVAEMEEGGIIMLDEAHCLKSKDQYYLLDLLEKNRMTYDSGKVIYLQTSFTFILATTDPDKLIPPLRSRFANQIHLEDYNDVEMAQIVERMARQVGISPTKPFCMSIGKASAGTPRQARSLVWAARDLGTTSDIDYILQTVGVTREGLTDGHIAFLEALATLDGKAGIKSIALIAERPLQTMEDVEKLLVEKGYVVRTPSGRELTYDGMLAYKAAKEFMEDF